MLALELRGHMARLKPFTSKRQQPIFAYHKQDKSASHKTHVYTVDEENGTVKIDGAVVPLAQLLHDISLLTGNYPTGAGQIFVVRV